MRALVTAVLTLLALPLSAANIRFDPPNPTSRTPVNAHIFVLSCGVESASVARTGSIISVTVNSFEACVPEVFGRHDAVVDLGVLPAGVYDVVASPGNLLVAIAEAFLPVADAAAPFRIEPNVFNSNVIGFPVRIVGSNLIKCAAGPAPVVCEDPAVKFGDAIAAVVSTAPDEIVVQPPQLPPGIVDVTLQTATTSARAVAAFRYFSFSESPDRAFFEPILFPVLYSGPGSFGSLWRTEVAMHNANPFPIDQPRGALFGGGCFPICDGRPPAHTTLIAFGGNFSTGLVDYVTRLAAPNLHFSLIVRDLSRDTNDFGTSVPVVREREFFDRPFSLLNVPADPRYRLGLRLYTYEPIPAALTVRIISHTTGGVLAERNVFLGPVGDHAFAFIGDLLTEFPQIAGKGPLRIEIAPTQEGTLAWSYVSITNNETQHVTVIAPE